MNGGASVSSSRPSCLLFEVTLGVLAALWCQLRRNLEFIPGTVGAPCSQLLPCGVWVRGRASLAEADSCLGRSLLSQLPVSGFSPGLAGSSLTSFWKVLVPRCTSHRTVLSLHAGLPSGHTDPPADALALTAAATAPNHLSSPADSQFIVAQSPCN